MAFMVMKLKSGSKTYALKIPKDDFVAIQKDPSLLAEYWDKVLEDEKGEQEEEPQVSRPVKRRSKSVGAESRGRKRLHPSDEEAITNGNVKRGRKKSRKKEFDNLISENSDDLLTAKSVSTNKGVVDSPEVPKPAKKADFEEKAKVVGSGKKGPSPDKKVKASKQCNQSGEKGGKKSKKAVVSPKSTLTEQVDLEPEKVTTCKENVCEPAGNNHSPGSPVKNKKRKTSKQAITPKAKGNKKGKKSLSPKSLFNDKIDLELSEPEATPIVEEQSAEEHSSSGSTENELHVKGKKASKHPTKATSKGVKKKGVDFQPLDEQESLEPAINEENVQGHNSNEIEPSPVKAFKQASSSNDTGILLDLPVTVPKKKGRKRKHVDVTSEECHPAPRKLVDQDEDSATVSEEISGNVPLSSPEKSNEKQLHGDMQENRPPNMACRRSVRHQHRQQKQDGAKCVAFSPDRGSMSPQAETHTSNSSESGEGLEENQLRVASSDSSQKITSVGSPKAKVQGNVKFVAPTKTFSGTSQTVPAESSVVTSKFILYPSLPQGTTMTPVHIQNLTPVSAPSTRYVPILPAPRPTTQVSQSLSAFSTVPVSTVGQAMEQQNLTTSSVGLPSFQSVMITPAHPGRSHQNIAQTVPFHNNCQLVQCVQTPFIAQNEVGSPAPSVTVNVAQKSALEQSPAQSSLRVTPVKRAVPMTLKDVSVAIKKFPQQMFTPINPTKCERLHDIKITPVKSLSSKTVATQDASQYTVQQNSEAPVITIQPAQNREHPLPSLKPASAKNIGPVPSKRKLTKIFTEVPLPSMASDLSEVELEPLQSPEVKQTEGMSRTAISEVVIQKGKLLQNQSSVQVPKDKFRTQLGQSNLPLSKLENVSLEQLKTSVAKKLPLKLVSKPESTGVKLRSDKNLIQEDKSVKDDVLSNNVSILVVPLNLQSASSGSSGSPSQSIAQVNVTEAVAGAKIQELLCDSSETKPCNLADVEGHGVESELRKCDKLPTTMGGKSTPLKRSLTTGAVVHSLFKVVTGVSAKCAQVHLSDDSDFKIVHPRTPVPPSISNVSKKMPAAETPRTSGDGSAVVSPKKVPKAGSVKVVKISQASAVCGNLLGVPHNVPNASRTVLTVSQSPSQPCSSVQSELPSHGMPGMSPAVSEMFSGASRASRLTELEHSAVSSVDLKAFETLLNEGLDSVTQILAEKALLCKGGWNANVCFSFLSQCLKEKDSFLASSPEDLNFETICSAMNGIFPGLNLTVSDCNERWWEFVSLYEAIAKKLEYVQQNECLSCPEARCTIFTIICQAMTCRKYPLSPKNLPQGNTNNRTNAALKFLNDIMCETDETAAFSLRAVSSAIPPDSVHQSVGVKHLRFIDLFMLLAVKTHQLKQSVEFYGDYIGETIQALTEEHNIS